MYMIFGICFAYQTNWFAKCTLITQIPWPYSTSRIGKVRGDETNYELELKQEQSLIMFIPPIFRLDCVHLSA